MSDHSKKNSGTPERCTNHERERHSESPHKKPSTSNGRQDNHTNNAYERERARELAFPEHSTQELTKEERILMDAIGFSSFNTTKGKKFFLVWGKTCVEGKRQKDFENYREFMEYLDTKDKLDYQEEKENYRAMKNNQRGSGDRKFDSRTSGNYGRSRSPKNYGRPSSQKSFGRSRSPKSFGRLSSPKSFGRLSSPKSFGRLSSPKSFGRLSSTKSFGRSSSPKSFGRSRSPKNFERSRSSKSRRRTRSPSNHRRSASPKRTRRSPHRSRNESPRNEIRQRERDSKSERDGGQYSSPISYRDRPSTSSGYSQSPLSYGRRR